MINYNCVSRIPCAFCIVDDNFMIARLYLQHSFSLNVDSSVLVYKRYSHSPKTEKEDLNALRMPPRDQTRINRSPICERTCCPSMVEDPPSMASLSGSGAGSLYRRVSPRGITGDERKDEGTR